MCTLGYNINQLKGVWVMNNNFINALQNILLDIGIEVTTAVDEKDLEMDSLFTYLESGLTRDKQKVIKIFNM